MTSSITGVAPAIAFSVILNIIGLLYVSQAAEPSPSNAQPVVSQVHLTTPGSPLRATISGKEIKIADAALAVWVIDHGQLVVYSGADGAGGYEDEGQSLHIYDARTGADKKILAEYYMIERVQEKKTTTGKIALLVSLRDGGLGASHVAVVDPLRGEIFYAGGATLIYEQGDALVVGFFKDDDWEKIRNGIDVRPYRTRRYDVKKLLRRPLIVRQKS